MNKKALTETDIRSKFITPALVGVNGDNWNLHTQIREEVYFTRGRVIVRGKTVKRGEAKKADYILSYKANLPLAVIEAKDNTHAVGAGMQQALEYAEILDVPFAYNSDGDAFLVDRKILTDQTKTNDFKPFGTAMTKITNRTVGKSSESSLRAQRSNPVTLLASPTRHTRASKVAGLLRRCAPRNDELHNVWAPFQAVTGTEEDQNIYKQFSPGFFDLVIIDECHRGSAADDAAWRKVLEYFSSATQIDLTATPKETKDVSNIEYFGDPIYTYSLRQGIADGFLAPYKVVRIGIDKDLDGWRPEIGQTDNYGNTIEDREYNDSDYDRHLILEKRTALVAAKITEFLRATDRFAKTIVFCENIDHAERMRQALVNANPDLAAANPKYVMRITGDNDEGKAQLDNFIDPEKTYPVIACTSRLMSTGVDAQTCHLIVLDRRIASMTEFKQIIGRGTRINEDYCPHNAFSSCRMVAATALAAPRDLHANSTTPVMAKRPDLQHARTGVTPRARRAGTTLRLPQVCLPQIKIKKPRCLYGRTAYVQYSNEINL